MAAPSSFLPAPGSNFQPGPGPASPMSFLPAPGSSFGQYPQSVQVRQEPQYQQQVLEVPRIHITTERIVEKQEPEQLPILERLLKALTQVVEVEYSVPPPADIPQQSCGAPPSRQAPGYAPMQGPGYAPPQGPGYAPPQGPGYGAPRGELLAGGPAPMPAPGQSFRALPEPGPRYLRQEVETGHDPWAPHMEHDDDEEEEEIQVEIVTKEVPKIEVRVVEKVVEVPEIEFVNRFVEVKQVVEIVKKVPRIQIKELPIERVIQVPKKVVQDVVKEVFRPVPHLVRKPIEHEILYPRSYMQTMEVVHQVPVGPDGSPLSPGNQLPGQMPPPMGPPMGPGAF